MVGARGGAVRWTYATRQTYGWHLPALTGRGLGGRRLPHAEAVTPEKLALITRVVDPLVCPRILGGHFAFRRCSVLWDSSRGVWFIFNVEVIVATACLISIHYLLYGPLYKYCVILDSSVFQTNGPLDLLGGGVQFISVRSLRFSVGD